MAAWVAVGTARADEVPSQRPVSLSLTDAVWCEREASVTFLLTNRSDRPLRVPILEPEEGHGCGHVRGQRWAGEIDVLVDFGEVSVVNLPPRTTYVVTEGRMKRVRDVHETMALYPGETRIFWYPMTGITVTNASLSVDLDLLVEDLPGYDGGWAAGIEDQPLQMERVTSDCAVVTVAGSPTRPMDTPSPREATLPKLEDEPRQSEASPECSWTSHAGIRWCSLPGQR